MIIRAQKRNDTGKDECAALVVFLRVCARKKDLFRGTRVHDEILRRGFLERCSDALITMYAKCGAIAKAEELFEKYKSRDVITWTALIAAYAHTGNGGNALDCFDQMRNEGLLPDAVTFSCILKACGTIGAFDIGERIHGELVKQGLLNRDVVLSTSLLHMYAKCGCLPKAREILDELLFRTVVSWNALITGYVEHGQGEQAVECFKVMRYEGCSPNIVTFLCVLKACSGIGAVHKGEEVHSDIAEQQLLGKDIWLGTALVDMYVKCGALAKASQVIEELPVRNVISWNALLIGYSEHGDGVQALNSFEVMQHEGLSPDAITFIGVLRACGSIGIAEKGEKVQDEIYKQVFLLDHDALGNALVDMYAKCGAFARARRVLEELPVRDVISWTSLIAGYAEHDEAQALDCFETMQQEGIFPDSATFICILKACCSIGAADKGDKIHHEIARKGLLVDDLALANAVVDMYAKCGELAKAQQILDKICIRDVNSWTALISGYAQQGEGIQALSCFKQMQCEGLAPNAATFSCILSACGRLGLVDSAQSYFLNMSTKYGLKPDLEQYTCMVDLFGRTGHLDKAVHLIKKFPSFDAGVWSALLGACQRWGDMNLGHRIFKHAIPCS